MDASGRHWRVSIERLACEAAEILSLDLRIRYIGPKVPAEAPLVRLVDASGRAWPPRGLVWQRGSREHAHWLSRGGVSVVLAGEVGTYRYRFDLGGARSPMLFEFGDIPGFLVTRGGCGGLHKLEELRAPARQAPGAKADRAPFRVFRGLYPCRTPDGGLQPVEANHPPQAPRQVLLFGRGYLPNARHVDLPEGRAAAQAYAYAGPDTTEGVDLAARRALQDFAGLRDALLVQGAGTGTLYAFDWGKERTPGGNELHAIGVYDLRPCRK